MTAESLEPLCPPIAGRLCARLLVFAALYAIAFYLIPFAIDFIQSITCAPHILFTSSGAE